MPAAAMVTLVDRRAALRDLELPAGVVWRRWTAYSRLAERLVTGRARFELFSKLIYPYNEPYI